MLCKNQGSHLSQIHLRAKARRFLCYAPPKGSVENSTLTWKLTQADIGARNISIKVMDRHSIVENNISVVILEQDI